MLPWSALEEYLAAAGRILLTTHDRPDGDALGSELAMAALIEQKGKEVVILNPSPTPPRYRFLDPSGTRIGGIVKGQPTPDHRPDLLIVLDTGTWLQLAGLADYLRSLAVPKVVIDHHVSQDDLGALRLVDASASACGMLVYEAFQRLDGRLDAESASALFVAIATDTGWMRHSNSTPEVFAVLGRLAASGARADQLYRAIYEGNSPARLRLMGTMLERIRLLAGGRLATSFVRQEDIHQAGAHPMDTEDFIGMPMSLAGVDTAVLFIEQRNGGTKVSFRSRGTLDCSKLAEQFGGGGHKPAAGAMLDWPIEEAQEQVLRAVEAALDSATAGPG